MPLFRSSGVYSLQETVIIFRRQFYYIPQPHKFIGQCLYTWLIDQWNESFYWQSRWKTEAYAFYFYVKDMMTCISIFYDIFHANPFMTHVVHSFELNLQNHDIVVFSDVQWWNSTTTHFNILQQYIYIYYTCYTLYNIISLSITR